MKRLIVTLIVGCFAMCGQGHAQHSCRCYRGVYVGWNFGYAFHNHLWTDKDNWLDEFGVSRGGVRTSHDGATIGVQTGYNMQCGRTVFGVEFDAGWADLETSKKYTSDATILRIHERLPYFGTARARIGLVAKDLLLFASMGVAWANFKHHWRIDDPAAIPTTESYVQNVSRRGLALGVGMEWMFCSLFSIKMETFYFTFPDRIHSVFSPNRSGAVRFNLSDSVWFARIGFNYKLCALWY